MAMADKCDVSDIVTTFLHNTCRIGLSPRPTLCNVQAAQSCAVTATKHLMTDKEAGFIPLITGSVAEFYIEPMLPLVGDIDVMFYINTLLAIPRGHPPPTQLPAEFHSSVKVVEITDRVPDITVSHFPGYVYLELRYLLTERSDGERYDCIEYKDGKYSQYYLQFINNDSSSQHGPAICRDHCKGFMPVDEVLCVRYLSWPLQADGWPTRHRNCGWPDSATLDRVVSNGCDVVPVAHRQCRQHEWMGKCQWRLSFSRAEIVLINSWMPVQQTVYHMLRYFIKTERLTDCADNSGTGKLSNYHIKTLMLWACELKPRSWWTENLKLVRICVELLNTLSVWLTDTRCPHYFINNCNLLDKSFNVGGVASTLLSIDERYLSTWFVNNYIGRCAQLCPGNVSRLFDDVSTSTKLQKVFLEIGRWRLNASFRDMWQAVDLAEWYIPVSVSHCPLSVRSCVYWMNEFTKIYKRFSVYFSAIALLHVACKTSRNGFSEGLIDVLRAVFGCNFTQRCSVLSQCETELDTSEFVELLQRFAVEHLTTYRQLVALDFASHDCHNRL